MSNYAILAPIITIRFVFIELCCNQSCLTALY